MDWAIDPITNIEINASDRDISKYRKYICPSCDAPVQLRKGERISPYFAHVIGQAQPDCERYLPGAFIDKSLIKTIERERLYRSLGLYVRIIESDERYSWHLELGIPDPDGTYGVLKIPFGYTGERVIPIHQIKSGGLRIRIKPYETVYSVTIENLNDGDWFNRIIQPIRGLANFTVFRYSSNGGSRILENGSLYWGRTYVVLWKINEEPNWFPTSEVLDVRYLQEQDSWTGIIVNLPFHYEQSVEYWVNNCLLRKVEHSPAEISLVSPMPDMRLPDGSLVIGSNSDIVVSIVGDLGARKWKEILMFSSSETRILRHTGNGMLPYLISLGQLGHGRTDIWIDDEFASGIQLLITPKKQKVYLERSSVMFIGIDNTSMQVISASLHSPGAVCFIKRLFTREIILEKIECPHGLNFLIKWKTSDRGKWIEKDLSDKLSGESSGAGNLQLLNILGELVFSKPKQLIIETTGFGSVKINFDSDVIHKKITMNKQWRKRINWLLTQSLNSNIIPISVYNYHIRHKLNYFSEQDKKLLNRLLKASISIQLISNFNSIVNDCYRVLQNKK